MRSAPVAPRAGAASFRAPAGNHVTVTVLLFAAYADALGQSSFELPLEPGSTVADVLGRLRSMPGAERLPPTPLVAVNQRFARVADTLRSGDEIAVIPPVAGG